MPNMSLKKNEMPSQDPNVRNKNFLEVALGYTEEQALDEAARCLRGRLSGHPRDLLSARRLRPCLPAGDAVREQVHPRHQG